MHHGTRFSSFKFEEAWLLEDDCEAVVSKGWTDYAHLNFIERLKMLGKIMTEWAKVRRKTNKRASKRLKSRLSLFLIMMLTMRR